MITAIIIILCALIASFFLTSNHLLQLLIKRRLHDEKSSIKSYSDRQIINIDYLKSLGREDITIKSKDNLNLHGFLIMNKEKSDKFIILVHGISIGYVGSLKYVETFYKRGFNILVIDQRRHGKSEGKYSTYGYYEKHDVDCWVNYIIERFGNNIYLGLHGESMGAGTVLQYTSINKYAKFIIADCGYSDMVKLLNYQIKHDYAKCLQPYLLIVAKLSRIRAINFAKFDFKHVSPIKVVHSTDLPILFIHGKEDYFVPWTMSVEMYNNKNSGYKQLLLVDGASHADSIEVNKKAYENAIDKFLSSI